MTKLILAKKIINLGGSLGFYLDAVSLVYLGVLPDGDQPQKTLATPITIKDNLTGIEVEKEVRINCRGNAYIQFFKKDMELMKLCKGDIRSFTLLTTYDPEID